MGRREEGDIAIGQLERDLWAAVPAEKTFEKRLAKIDGMFHRAAEPWGRAGDDRVLSGMIITAAAVVDDAIREEISGIRDDHILTPAEKQDALLSAGRMAEAVAWLPDGTKSSIKLELAFAHFDISGIK